MTNWYQYQWYDALRVPWVRDGEAPPTWETLDELAERLRSSSEPPLPS